MNNYIKGLTNASRGSNVGKNTAALYPSLVVSGILVPYNWTMAIAPGDSDITILANLQTALSGLLLNNSYAARAFYIGPFESFNDKSEATTYQTLGYGRKVKTQRQIITKEYQLLDGGVQYWSAVQSFTGKINQYKWAEIDNEGVFYGTKTVDPTTGLVTGIQGIELSALEPQDRKQANKSTVEEYILNLTFLRSAEVNENLYTIETGIELDAFVGDLGIQDVEITATGVMVAKVVSCAINAADYGINLCTTLPGLIVSASFAFKNTETGSTAVTLTSVAIVNGLAVFTFAGTGAGWIPGNHVEISLVSVSTLSAAGFKYYESTVPVCSVVMVA